ncbi:MAG: PDZ domain-containing protein, partial [Phycisphaerae bacterium]|nr:PDZ domain-containing protein [Phycisphaerae bacterium]
MAAGVRPAVGVRAGGRAMRKEFRVVSILLRSRTFVAALVSVGVVGAGHAAQEPADKAPTLSPEWVKSFQWRSIGPANMGGRMTDMAVYPKDPMTFWVATASAGLIKTVNGGQTFEHQFEHEGTASVGAVAVAATDPNIVWVGTGEANPRNSVTWGDGVYKSTDGGKTWTHMGLRETFQVSRVIIHPTNHDVVYVGAMGRCWGTNEERGLFKTSDGGKTWSKILYVDDKTGVIDAAMHPTEPDTLLVATWERQRDGFDTNDPAKKWGPGSGLHKTSDGGQTFKRLTGGLPDTNLGRIGLSFYLKDPTHVYAIMESDRAGMSSANAPYLGVTGENADAGAKITRVVEGGPAGAGGLKVNEIVVAVDGSPIVTYQALLDSIRDKAPGDKVTLQVAREGKPVDVEITLAARPGNANDRPFGTRLGGQNPNIHDQQGADGWRTGGLYKSTDTGESWTRINSIAPRPMYFSKVRVDPTDENHIYVLGVSLHGSTDNGKKFTEEVGAGTHADHHTMWINPADGRHMLLGNDGGLYLTHDRGKTWEHLNSMALGQFYHVAVDSRPVTYNAYGGLQDNGSWGGPTRTRRGSIINSDWFRIGSGDGFVCAVDPDDSDQLYYESQNGATAWRNVRTGRGGSLRPPAERGLRFRFNWKTPFVLSHHNPGIYYNAGNYVFRTLTAGKEIKRISPEITRTERGSATALAESSLDADVLYVGTDDGALWMTRDGGKEWVDLFKVTPEAPADSPEPRRPTIAARNGGDGPPAAGGGGRGGGFIARLDANGDGKIERSEVPERMAAFFDQADGNGDGVIDAAEMEALASRIPGGREGRGGRTAAAGEEAVESQGGEEASEPQAQPPAQPERREAPAPPADPFTGTWRVEPVGELPGGGGTGFDIELALGSDGKLTGRMAGRGEGATLAGGTFDKDTGEFKFEYDGPLGPMIIEGKVEGDRMTGRSAGKEATFSFSFAGRRQDGERARRSRERSEPRVAGKPIAELVADPLWVSSLEASRAERGRVYLTLDGHRSDDDRPHVFASEDYGRTWRSITANLPGNGSAKAIREDLRNADILYLGTEFAAFVSINRGQDWTRLNNNLPTVAVHDFAQHPTTGEIVAGTHGRSLWVLDITALRQMTPTTIAAPAHLYKPNDVTVLRGDLSRGSVGMLGFRGQNPSGTPQIFYSLGAAAGEVALKVTTLDGRVVDEPASPPKSAGLHRIALERRGGPGGGRGPTGGGPQGAAQAPTGAQ